MNQGDGRAEVGHRRKFYLDETRRYVDKIRSVQYPPAPIENKLLIYVKNGVDIKSGVVQQAQGQIPKRSSSRPSGEGSRW